MLHHPDIAEQLEAMKTDFAQRLEGHTIPLGLAAKNHILGTYIAGISVRFQHLLEQSCRTAQSIDAKRALERNAACEQTDNHVGMLFDVAIQCGLTLRGEHMLPTHNIWLKIYKATRDTKKAALIEIAILAVLENLSPVFIPFLEAIAIGLGLTNPIYFDAHGEADKAHSAELVVALLSEMRMDYQQPEAAVQEGFRLALELLDCIFGTKEEAA